VVYTAKSKLFLYVVDVEYAYDILVYEMFK